MDRDSLSLSLMSVFVRDMALPSGDCTLLPRVSLIPPSAHTGGGVVSAAGSLEHRQVVVFSQTERHSQLFLPLGDLSTNQLDEWVTAAVANS